MSTISRRDSSLQVDTAGPTPSATTSSVPTHINNICSASSDCADDGVCSNGTCTSVTQAAPFAPAGTLGSEPTTQLDTKTAVGIGVGAVVFVILLIGAGFWFFKWRRRRQKPLPSPEAPQTTRDRSASTATRWTIDNDQKTLVASMPNSPQHAAFTAQTPGLPSAFYTNPGKVIEEEKTEPSKEIAEYRRQDAPNRHEQTTTSPIDKALPEPPVEEKRYAINVNINKSMIFDDIMFNAASYAPSTVVTPQERAPRYRFEEYLPPVPASNPRISITRTSKSRASSMMSSEYELDNYPHGSAFIDSYRHSYRSMSDTGSEYRRSGNLGRDDALSKLQGNLSLPELPPPSPSFSFRSYDWYQDIIGGDQSAVESPSDLPATPELPSRNPARDINPLLSNPPDTNTGPSYMAEPLSPAFPSPVASSHLHPDSARLSHFPLPLSPSSPNFRLSPTVYQMPNPSRVSKLVPSLPSTRPVSMESASTVHRWSRNYSNHYSQRWSRYASWLPDDDIPQDDLLPPQYPRYQSMVASIVQGSEATQTARTTARNSIRNTARNSRSRSAPRPQSSMTQKSHFSRSWLPDDGLYLPEEGTDDSFEVFQRERLRSRPTSYSPLG